MINPQAHDPKSYRDGVFRAPKLKQHVSPKREWSNIDAIPLYGDHSMSTTSQTRHAFRQRLAQPGIVVAPGTGDALGARLIQQAGFEAVYMSGYAVESTFGKPDVGLTTLTEMAGRAGQIADAVSVPVIADADTGYGNVINVARTVREFERAGVCAIQIEDQALPKKCGSMKGKAIVSKQEMVGKIRAVLDTRSDENLLLIARSDALAVEGLDATWERLHAYKEAGADMLMVLGPYSLEIATNFISKSPAPHAYLDSESFTMPMIPVKELERLGAKLVIFPLAITLSIPHAIRKTLQVIREAGTTEAYAKGNMVSWAECNEILGFSEIHDLERKYL